MSTSRRHDFNPHEWHERYDVDKSTARFFFARIARYRQVDDTIFMAREGNRSCLPLAEIVFIRAFRARKHRVFRLRKSCHSCRSCRKNRARKYRVFRLRKSCSFVPFVQDKNRARKYRVFRLRKSCHSCLLCKIRIVQEVSCKIQRIHLTQKHGDTEAHFFWH